MHVLSQGSVVLEAGATLWALLGPTFLFMSLQLFLVGKLLIAVLAPLFESPVFVQLLLTSLLVSPQSCRGFGLPFVLKGFSTNFTGEVNIMSPHVCGQGTRRAASFSTKLTLDIFSNFQMNLFSGQQ